MASNDQSDLEEVRRQQQSAADLIRNKLNAIYAEEPNAKEEIAEVESVPSKQLSKHQLYMKELGESGKSMAEIQTAWHQYYTGLPDDEKHQVWQEFYSEHARIKAQPAVKKEEPREEPEQVSGTEQKTPEQTQPQPTLLSHNTATARRKRRSKTTGKARAITTKSTAAKAIAAKAPKLDTRTASDIRQHLINQVQSRSHVAKNPHVRSLAFGLSMGFLTLFVLLFGFFNERFITPFIRPSTNVSATPIIVDPTANAPVGPESKIIIPKINVEAPVIYDVPTIEEADIQKGLEKGVVHYITTPNPGEKGNSVIFGHSSSNILNKGKYKFAFLLLKSLDKEDTFIVQKDGKRYVYKVYNKFVTSPTDFSVLGPTDKPATMTLITCDPPGTSTNRLIIQAEQIFPDPAGNTASSAQPNTQQPTQLPSNSVSLWQRIVNWF